MRIRICFFPKIREKSADTVRPMAGPGGGEGGRGHGRGVRAGTGRPRGGWGATAAGGGAAAASARPGPRDVTSAPPPAGQAPPSNRRLRPVPAPSPAPAHPEGAFPSQRDAAARGWMSKQVRAARVSRVPAGEWRGFRRKGFVGAQRARPILGDRLLGSGWRRAARSALPVWPVATGGVDRVCRSRRCLQRAPLPG